MITVFFVKTDDNRFSVGMNNEQIREGRGKKYLRNPSSSSCPFCTWKSRERVVRLSDVFLELPAVGLLELRAFELPAVGLLELCKQLLRED